MMKNRNDIELRVILAIVSIIDTHTKSGKKQT